MSNYLKVEMLQSGAVLGTDALTSSLTTDTTGATPATYANLTVAAGDLVVKDSADVVKGDVKASVPSPAPDCNISTFK